MTEIVLAPTIVALIYEIKWNDRKEVLYYVLQGIFHLVAKGIGRC